MTARNAIARAILAQELRYGLIHELADPHMASLVGKLEAAVPQNTPWLRLAKAPLFREDRALIRTLFAGGAVSSLALASPDVSPERRSWLLAGLNNGDIILFNWDRDGEPFVLGDPLWLADLSSVAASLDLRDGASPAVLEEIKELKRSIKELKRQKPAVTSVALSADASFAISGSYDKTVRIWDLEDTGQCQRELAHSSYVHSVAMSADASRALSGSEDGTLRIWIWHCRQGGGETLHGREPSLCAWTVKVIRQPAMSGT